MTLSLCRLRPARRLFSTAPHVCVVGSGPAAFYTAQSLLKANADLRVDLLEKLPVPFGLVRYGVAPDHPEVKNVINSFTAVARNPRVRFFGNVSVGEDVSVTELRRSYTAVVLAYGAAKDRRLDIPGEHLPGVLSARDLVGWYNGLPENADLSPPLDGATAVVVGHGNVALDVARILLSPLALLRRTDIPEPVLAALGRSRVRRVVLLGRRGVLQAAFTIKEVREMLRLPACASDLSHVAATCPHVPEGLSRPRRRLTELLLANADAETDGERQWALRFMRSPEEIVGDERGVTGIRVRVNEFECPDDFASPSAAVKPSADTEFLPCSLVLRSIGYQSTRVDPSVPWDAATARVPNERGHVEGNLFCAGWIKRGPTGVLLSTLADGRETAAELLRRLDALPAGDGADAVTERLRASSTSFEDWEKIDAVETRRGKKAGKPREKMTSVQEMMSVAENTDE